MKKFSRILNRKSVIRRKLQVFFIVKKTENDFHFPLFIEVVGKMFSFCKNLSSFGIVFYISCIYLRDCKPQKILCNKKMIFYTKWWSHLCTCKYSSWPYYKSSTSQLCSFLGLNCAAHHTFCSFNRKASRDFLLWIVHLISTSQHITVHTLYSWLLN